MTVAAILASKGREVATGTAGMPVAEIVTYLAEHKIGALVIVDDSRRISGIISERDIVRVLAASGVSALDLPVEEVMTRDVVTCAEAETINDVMERMTRGRFRHMPVTGDDGVLAGIISIGDVVKARIGQVEREAEEMRSYIATA